MKKILITIAILLMSLTADAKVTKLQKILFELGFIQDPYVQICPEDMEIDWDASEQELWAKAQRASDGYNKCEPAKYYKSLIVNYGASPRYKEAYRAYIDTFMNAQDFIMVINEANIYIEMNNHKNDSEYMHLQLLRAVEGEIKQTWRSKERQMEFVSLSLGAALTQTEETPYLLNLQFHSFLDRYPNSYYKNEVLAMLNGSRQMYGKNVLSEARMFLVKRDYPMAFKKYDVILKWGPVVEVFEEALYEMIQYHMELSWILTDKRLLSDFQLNEFLKRDYSTVSTKEERMELSKQTRAQGLQYLEQMKKNLPNSPWTAKAIKISEAYPIF
ncbi:outer membrane protein assembly factor BamD [Bdellovibrio sp. 22V]|uniref:outer membrane protein assembly factor BamD n=1 Tax=Bdellovibrio sp. 22V TaxID=3044166 RepID=UPI0025432523|nr:outer membrane protein assembly factor BamD [Bdellovibrio sp. 22V]WII73586.1 outer membrane protein assembly factor BamD [Bdellovibrio sp. 22V]